MKVLEISEWETPATHYPDGIYGKVELRTLYCKPAFLYATHAEKPKNDFQNYDYFQPKQPLPIKALYIDGKQWMVDDPSHWWAMQRFADLYHGNVLIAGLGLGLIVHALQNNPKVTKITAIEKEIVIISLMKDFLPYPNTTFVCQDWDNFVPQEKIDGVFYDLFVGDPESLAPKAIEVLESLKIKFPKAIHHIHGFSIENLLNKRIGG